MTRHRVGLLPYWLVAPTILIVTAFIIYPVYETFRLSLTNTNLILAARIPRSTWGSPPTESRSRIRCCPWS